MNNSNINDVNSGDNSETEWLFKGDYNWLNNTIAPIFNGFEDDQVNDGVILIDPESKTYDTNWITKRCNYDDQPKYVFGRIFTIKIPGFVKGKALVEIFNHKKFTELLKTIEDGYSLEWNGKNQVGKLNEISTQKLEDFTCWMENDFNIRDKVDSIDTAYDFIESIEFLDKNGNDVGYGEDKSHEVVAITIRSGEYFINYQTDIDKLVDKIDDDYPNMMIGDLKPIILYMIDGYF